MFNKQKKPYSNCDFIEDENGNFEYPSSTFSRKYYDQIKSAGYEYSQSMCISFCQIDKSNLNCSLGFSSINAPKNNFDNLCSFGDDNNSSFIDLIMYFSELYYGNYKNSDVDKECDKMCPLECKYEQYDLYLTKNKQRNTSDFYSSAIYVTLYFDSPSYLNYDESPSISVYNLVSNVGGAIGLLLGMSLLSIFEVLEMIILSIFLIIKHKYKSFKLKRQKRDESIV